jgi:hypothetical protein
VDRPHFFPAAIALSLLLPLAGAGGFPAASGRSFPDTSTRIGVFADQLPGGLTEAQTTFAATHYVGTQKLTLDLSRPLRAINPNFLVLHYHLAMWQAAPPVQFIVDGQTWANDYSTVNRHEAWFWHNQQREQVASRQDGKLLMNIADPGFRAYWRDSIVAQVQAGDYDGVFLDSASPALLQWEAPAGADPRLSGTGVRDHTFPELGGRSWIAAWQDWIRSLDVALASKRIPLIPNTGAFATTWDDTNYSLTSGVFSEGFSDPTLSASEWTNAMNTTLRMVRKNKIVILQNYLASTSDVEKRRYLLANYLLAKGRRTYVFYFASSPLEWYPEWSLDLGEARTTADSVDELAWNGVYRRDFAKGVVFVNPATTPVRVNPGTGVKRVELLGGGEVSRSGSVTGTLGMSSMDTLEIAPKSAEIVMR